MAAYRQLLIIWFMSRNVYVEMNVYNRWMATCTAEYYFHQKGWRILYIHISISYSWHIHRWIFTFIITIWRIFTIQAESILLTIINIVEYFIMLFVTARQAVVAFCFQTNLALLQLHFFDVLLALQLHLRKLCPPLIVFLS